MRGFTSLDPFGLENGLGGCRSLAVFWKLGLGVSKDVGRQRVDEYLYSYIGDTRMEISKLAAV